VSAVRTAVALTIAGLTLFSGTTHAATADTNTVGIRLLEAPVERQDDPRAQLYVVDHVAPGAVLTRQFEVRNGTAAAAQIDLYGAAADAADGGWDVSDGRAQNELTEWMTVTPASLRLAAGERAQATVELRVPDDASEGERYAAILAELPGTPQPGSQITLNARVGIRVYLSIGPGGEPVSDFDVSTLTPQRLGDGTPAVTAQVTNTGGRALDLSGDLELTDGPGGLRAGPFPVDVRTLGIGDTGDVSVILDEALPAGPWQARLVMRSGRLEKAVEATITFPEAAGEIGARIEAADVPLAEDPSVVVPVAIGLLFLAVLMLLWLLLRRRPKDDEDDDEQSTPAALPAPRRSHETVRS
jgi:hypothetical protein